jgi:hypothetical protein
MSLQDTEAENTDTRQTTSNPTTTSTKSLVNKLNITFLQNQYSFMTYMLDWELRKVQTVQNLLNHWIPLVHSEYRASHD